MSFKKTVFGILIAVMLGGQPASVAAVTVDELLVQVQSLLAVIQSLQAQITALQKARQDFCYAWTTTLKTGSRSTSTTSGDLWALRTALNKEGFAIATTTDILAGNKGFVYGTATAAAVAKLQEKYKSEILTPVRLTKGTGVFGASTRAKLNRIYKCVPAVSSSTTNTSTSVSGGTTGTAVPSTGSDAASSANAPKSTVTIPASGGGGGGGGGSSPATSGSAATSGTVSSPPPPAAEVSKTAVQVKPADWDTKRPWISYVTPASITQGSSVTVVGDTFVPTSEVRLNGMLMEVESITPTEIRIKTLSYIRGKYQAVVFNPQGTTSEFVTYSNPVEFTITESPTPLPSSPVPAGTLPKAVITMSVNGSQNPAAIEYDSTFLLSWEARNATICMGAGHYVPLASGGLWNSQTVRPLSGSIELKARHATFGKVTPLQISMTCWHEDEPAQTYFEQTILIPLK